MAVNLIQKVWFISMVDFPAQIFFSNSFCFIFLQSSIIINIFSYEQNNDNGERGGQDTKNVGYWS